MGGTFVKLTYPFATYSILAAADALMPVATAHTDARLLGVVDAILASKEDGS